MIGDLRLAKPSMQTRLKLAVLALLLSTLNSQLSTVLAFEGRIYAMSTQGSQTQALLYTVGTNFLRVENTATNWPNPVDILDRNSGELTLLFPNNRSFVHLKPAAENSSVALPGFPQMPGGLPPGVGPQSQPPGAPAMPNLPTPQGIGPTNLPGMPALPGPATMPAPPSGLPPGVGPATSHPARAHLPCPRCRICLPVEECLPCPRCR